MKELDINTVESSELVEQTFNFWFSDHGHIRSPFPSYIHAPLREKATNLFYRWANGLDAKAKEELNDEMIGEKFEEIIFETATGLIKTEDERITIVYPFLPRLGDKLEEGLGESSIVVDRFIRKDGDKSFLKLTLEKEKTKEKWDSEIELPL